MTRKEIPGAPGDWLEVHELGGGPVHRGQIVEVLGAAGHEHYRVRWTDEHESIFFPADGTRIVHASEEASPR